MVFKIDFLDKMIETLLTFTTSIFTVKEQRQSSLSYELLRGTSRSEIATSFEKTQIVREVFGRRNSRALDDYEQMLELVTQHRYTKDFKENRKKFLQFAKEYEEQVRNFANTSLRKLK